MANTLYKKAKWAVTVPLIICATFLGSFVLAILGTLMGKLSSVNLHENPVIYFFSISVIASWIVPIPCAVAEMFGLLLAREAKRAGAAHTGRLIALGVIGLFLSVLTAGLFFAVLYYGGQRV